MVRVRRTLHQYDLPVQLAKLLQAVYAQRFLPEGVGLEQILAEVLVAC